MVHPYDLGLTTTRPSLDLGSIDITDDPDIRSPRTPIYQPLSSFSSNLSPFDPTKLFSNLTVPLTPKAFAPTKKTLPPPPSDPLAWVWQCHLCRSRWALGVTRRCLIDGHFYCSGETGQPNLKKKKKGQSCSSELDYVGWKDYGKWKRNPLQTMSNPRVPRGCERCEFPSQCRYGPADSKLTGEQPSNPTIEGVEYASSTAAQEDVARSCSSEYVTLESILAKAEAAGKSAQSKMTDFYRNDGLKRSKSEEGRLKGDKVAKAADKRPSKRPSLAPIAEEALKNETGTGLQDLVMPLIDFWGLTKEKRKSFP